MALIVDGMNVIGSVPDGWWRDRTGAMRRLLRQLEPGTVLVLAPLYVLWKIPVYLGFLFRRQKAWVRTPRDLPQSPQ